jgi:hypothetical protein
MSLLLGSSFCVKTYFSAAAGLLFPEAAAHGPLGRVPISGAGALPQNDIRVILRFWSFA